MQKALLRDTAADSPMRHERTVTILPSGITVGVRDGETIVDALRRQGLRTRYKCRRGGCGACRATLVAGRIGYRMPVSTTVVEGPEGHNGKQHCLPCRATPRSDVVIALGPHDRVVDVLSGLARGRTADTAAVSTTEPTTP